MKFKKGFWLDNTKTYNKYDTSKEKKRRIYESLIKDMKMIMDEEEQMAILNRLNSNNSDELDAYLRNKLDFKSSNINFNTNTKSFLFEKEHTNYKHNDNRFD